MDLKCFLSYLFSGASAAVSQQFFRARPRDTTVSVGGSAVVECEVANLAGRVQWTKDGLTMGKTLKEDRVAK